MAIAEILLLGHPALRSNCEKVSDFSDPAICRTIENLRDTLNRFRVDHGFGRGIAAPQIGVPKRIIFTDVDGPMALVNPEIVSHSRRTMTLWDDCFSFPDILVKVRRFVKIAVAFHDEDGRKKRLEAEDGMAELLQHEIDHVNGILAIDRAIDSSHIVLRSEWIKMRDREQENHPL
jgi:peptide deformylase